jgi:hypothetical protein
MHVRECQWGGGCASSSDVAGVLGGLDKDRGERGHAFAGSDDVEGRFREWEEDMDKTTALGCHRSM